MFILRIWTKQLFSFSPYQIAFNHIALCYAHIRIVVVTTNHFKNLFGFFEKFECILNSVWLGFYYAKPVQFGQIGMTDKFVLKMLINQTDCP